MNNLMIKENMVEAPGLSFRAEGSLHKLCVGSEISIGKEELTVKEVFSSESQSSDKLFFIAKLSDDSYIFISSYQYGVAFNRVGADAMRSLRNLVVIATEKDEAEVLSHKIFFDNGV